MAPLAIWQVFGLRSALFQTSVKITTDFHVDNLASSHVGVGRLGGREHAGEFAGFWIHLGDREGHLTNAIDVALDVLAIQFLVVTSQTNQTLGIVHTGGEGTTLGINEVARAVAGGAVGAFEVSTSGDGSAISCGFKRLTGEGEGVLLTARNQHGDRLKVDTALLAEIDAVALHGEVAVHLIKAGGEASEDLALNELSLLTLVRGLTFHENPCGMHADALELIGATGGEADRSAGGIRNNWAIIRFAGVANVVVSDVGTVNSLGTTAAGGHHGETESQHQGQQGTDAHERKPNGRMMTVSTDQADPTGGKRLFRVPFRSCKQPVALSVLSHEIETLPSAEQERLEALLAELNALAGHLQGRPQALLTMLRSIEALHRDIQDGSFRSSLPEDRHQLFNLLQAIERSGGWPYIPRLQLKTFIAMLDQPQVEMAA